MAHSTTPPSAMPAGQAVKKKKILRIVAVAIIVAVVISIIATAFYLANRDEYSRYTAERKVVATCDGYDILYEELRFVTLFYKDVLSETHGFFIWEDPATAETYRKELEEMVLSNLNQNYVVLSTCRYLGIPTESKEMDAYVNDQMAIIKDSFNTREDFESWMDEHWMTEHYFRFSIGISYLDDQIYNHMLDKGMYAYSHDNIPDFKKFVENSGEFVRTIHIFIENVEGEDPDENLALATEFANSLKAKTDPHERRSLMSEYIGSKYNDDLKSLTGDGYYFTRGEMDKAYEQAAFALQMGETSDPVVCSGGNFVIMRLAPESDYITDNMQTLLNNYHSVMMTKYKEQFRKDCVVSFNDYGKTIDLLSIE